MKDLGLSEKQLNQVIGVLKKFPQIERAVMFGSRAKGNYKKYSDVDLCLFGNLDYSFDEHVKLALDELYIIYEFDVLNYNNLTNEALKEHINRVGVEIYKKGN